jgi:hypothetical protein
LYVIICTYCHTTQRVPLVEQELLTLPEHMSSPPGFSGVRVTWSFVLCVCVVDRCLSFFFWPLCCLFFYDIRFWLPLWYLQTLLYTLLNTSWYIVNKTYSVRNKHTLYFMCITSSVLVKLEIKNTIETNVCFIPLPTHRHWQWGLVKNEALRQQRRSQFHHYELSVYMSQYPSK